MKIKKTKQRRFIKTITFLTIAIVLLFILSFMAQPIWTSWNNYNTTHGIYEEPENTIETLFLGSSIVASGISPMELYENYGICSYVVGTAQQPVMSSYYWLKEVYDMHADTLNTVVMDVSSLTYKPEISRYHESIDFMRFSLNKLQAIAAYSGNFSDFLVNTIPLLSYHDRWKDLTSEDFLKVGMKADLSPRGYRFSVSRWINDVDSYSDINFLSYVLDDQAEPSQLDEEALLYFDKIVTFCKDKNLKLVLIKLPAFWNSEKHNAIQQLADQYDLNYLDFNFDPYCSEVGYDLAVDTMNPSDVESIHPNYWGSVKLTDYIGTYLTQVCENHDVRGKESYAFMEDELEGYHRFIVQSDLVGFVNPCDYLSYVLEKEDYTIFLSVKGDAANALTEEQREYFASIGLEKLANLTTDESYLAVIQDGNLTVELSKMDPDSLLLNGDDNKQNTKDGDGILTYKGKLSNGKDYVITSGGSNLGNNSSVLINGEEYSSNKQGLNIVLYDNQREDVADHTNFNTSQSAERQNENCGELLTEQLANGYTFSELEGKERLLYQYHCACDDQIMIASIHQRLGKNDLSSYLNAFSDNENIMIFLATQNNVAQAMDEETRVELVKLGLEELSTLENQDAYVAVMNKGEVLFEDESREAGQTIKSDIDYYLESNNGEYEGTSSIKVDGVEYSPKMDGLNIVVYDCLTESVIDITNYGKYGLLFEILEET